MRTSGADVRNLILLSLATVAGGFLTPGLPFLGLPLAAFALCWITYRFGLPAGVATALVAAALVGAFGQFLGLADPLDAIFVVLALAIVGPATASALRRFPALGVLLGVALALTAVFVASPTGAATLSAMIASVPAFVKSGLIATGASTTQTRQISATVMLYRQAWPWIAYYLMGLTALIVVPLASRAARSLAVDVRRYPPLAQIDVSFHFVWPAIAGIAALAGGSFAKMPLLGTIGLDILLFVRPVLVAQGLGDFAALYRRANAGRFMKGLGYTLLLATELFIPLVSLLGLIDIFFNLRKLPRGGARPLAGAPLA